MKVIAKCGECGTQHHIEHNPRIPDNQASDWYTKHFGHKRVTFEWPERSTRHSLQTRRVRNARFVRHPGGRRVFSGTPIDEPRQRVYRPVTPHDLFAFLDNANVNVAYASSAAPTLTCASLAASSSWLSGRESSSVSNTSNKYLDYLIAGNFRAAASNNQAGSIFLCVVGPRDDTPTWPDVFDGTDSVETVGKQGIFDAVCRMAISIAADNTASQTWYGGPISLASLFGGVTPTAWVYFLTHNIQTTTAAWSATEGDHSVKHTGVYLTVV